MSTPSTTSTPPPAFAGLTSKRLASLGKSLVKISSAYAIENRLEKAFGDWEVGLRGLWHLVRHGAVDCDKNLQLLVVLKDDSKRGEASEDRLAALEQLLRSITTDRPENYPSYMAGVPMLLFELTEYLYTHAPERARALYPEVQANVQAALALIMHFHAEPLGPELAEQLSAALVSSVGAPGPVDARFDVDRIVAQLGTVDAFERAAIEVLADEDRALVTPQGLGTPLRSASPELVVAGLRRFLRHNSMPSQWAEVRDALRQRDDLEQVARAIPATGLEGVQADPIRLIVFPLFDTLPAGLEDQLSFFGLHAPERVDEYREVLRRMGEDRAAALARRALDDASLRECQRMWIPLLGMFGPPAAPLVREAVAQGLTQHIELAPAELLA